MKFALFLRNVNLGRSHCPSKQQFEDAFLRAGADSATSFLTNGTMVYAASSMQRARTVFELAYAQLQEACGLREPAFVRSLAYLSVLAGLDPFRDVDQADVYGCYVSFLHSRDDRPPALPMKSANGNVELVQVTPAEVLSVARAIGKAPGSPNAFLEKVVGAPLTTRSWNTLVRLVERHG
jgi:uncharacterized protein (DUF1697 family)